MPNISKMNFHLLRLPILAIFEVLSTMNPFEIINFSMTSTRSKRIIKLFFRCDCKFKIELGIASHFDITIGGTRTKWIYEFTTDRALDDAEKYSFDDWKLQNTETKLKYSTNVIESGLDLFRYIDDLMKFKRLEGLTYSMNHYPLLNDRIIQEVTRLKRPMMYLTLYASKNIENDIKAMLESVEIKEFLSLSVPFSENFEMVVPSSLDHLYFEDGKWIKLKHLLEFNSVRIIIKGSKLTNLELTTFFVSWMFSKCHLNLYHFEISVENYEVFQNISQNLPHEEIDGNVVRKRHSVPSDYVVQEWFYIKRNDGTLGLIFLFHYSSNPNVLMLGMFVG